MTHPIDKEPLISEKTVTRGVKEHEAEDNENQLKITYRDDPAILRKGSYVGEFL